MLSRRSIALALAATAVLATPAWAARPIVLSMEDQALVAKAAAYLQGLTEAKGQFVRDRRPGRPRPGRGDDQASGSGPFRL